MSAAAIAEVTPIEEPPKANPQANSQAKLALDDFLAGSPLAGMGDVFIDAAAAHGIDPRLMPAVALWESSLGRLGCVTETRNPFGLKPRDLSATCRTFATYEEAIWVATATFGGYGVPTETGLCWWVAGPSGVCDFGYVARVLATMEALR